MAEEVEEVEEDDDEVKEEDDEEEDDEEEEEEGVAAAAVLKEWPLFVLRVWSCLVPTTMVSRPSCNNCRARRTRSEPCGISWRNASKYGTVASLFFFDLAPPPEFDLVDATIRSTSLCCWYRSSSCSFARSCNRRAWPAWTNTSSIMFAREHTDIEAA